VIGNYLASVICAGLLAQGIILSRLICLLHKRVYGPPRKPSTFAHGRILRNCANRSAQPANLDKLLSATFLPRRTGRRFLDFQFREISGSEFESLRVLQEQ
jgi:hypothetical protein